MNERIKELMVELKKTVSTHRGDAVLIGYDEIEKFAELIVRECADICYNHPARMPSNNWQGVTVPLDISQRLKEHFGVEE